MEFYSNISTSSPALASSLYPTIFEILSSDEIDELLAPSVRYIVANLVARKPNRYTLAINNWFDEWFLLATKLAIESRYLSRWDGTFIENFYGLKRINVSDSVLLRTLQKTPDLELPLRLTNKQRSAVLFQKVLVPYLGTKLDVAHSKLFASALVRDPQHNTNGTLPKIRKGLRNAFVKYYPLLKKLVFLLNLAAKLYFLSGKTGATSLVDLFMHVSYARLSTSDYERNETKDPSQASGRQSRRVRLNKTAFLYLLRMWGSKLGSVVKNVASQVFPAFIFMLRVFQWWTSQDLTNELQRNIDNIDEDVPPPPIPFERNINGKCRICDTVITNPAAIETGYVFCYPCIMSYLPMHEGTCPVTGSKLLGCKYDKESGDWSITGVRKLMV
ncbi:LAME_0G14268g1_1 [Lachancea meyersii CBS 8951]|uniref:Peroxisome assembly protein 12 n=1 Tax=Lachancea meyersii CBS 8951 TaxID=1266667 RepID=A0A1G4KAE9_9SACH|nr:LAME_0G14268g1_1 [Lachancea meyersii CBS 8951]